MKGGGTMGTKWRAQTLTTAELKNHRFWKSTTAAVPTRSSLSAHCMDNNGFMSIKKWLVNNLSPQSIEHKPAGDEVVVDRFHFGWRSSPLLPWTTTASWAGDWQLLMVHQNDKGTDGQVAGAIAFLKRVFKFVVAIDCRPRAHTAGSKR